MNFRPWFLLYYGLRGEYLKRTDDPHVALEHFRFLKRDESLYNYGKVLIITDYKQKVAKK